MTCKIKKVKQFKKNEKWYLPPDKIQNIRGIIELALKHAQYSENPSKYFNLMNARLTKILELEEKDKDCICGIKFSGNICYIPSQK